jgi:hypothetical protein
MLIIKETKHSPLVSFNTETGVFELRGSSFLDNAHEFYTPIIDWLKDHSKAPISNIRLVFDLNYINTSSQRMVFDMLKRVDQMHKAGCKISVEWLYDENDDDLKDVGDDLLSFMEFPYKIIEKVS